MTELSREAVNASVDRFVTAWNRGDLEAACLEYANDATMVAPEIYARGREQICAVYRKAYPDSAAMGRLYITTCEFRMAQSPDRTPAMASAIFNWSVKAADGSDSSGYSLVVYMLCDGEVKAVQDLGA